MALRPHELRTRLGADYASVMAICGELIEAHPFRSLQDRAPLPREEALSGRARVYLVKYNFPTLEGPGKLRSGACVRFDLTGPDYPYQPPKTQAVGWVPWLPHFYAPSGVVCLGPSWSTRRGRYQLATLVLHVGRLLNADEPCTEDAYDVATLDYLASTYKGKPINQGLALPDVPTELLHGTIEAPKASFTMVPRASSPASGFTLVGDAPGVFRRVNLGSGR